MRSRICFWINHCFISCSNNTYLKRYKICFLIFVCTSRKCVNYSVVKLLSTQCLSHVRCHRERRRPVCKGCFGVCSHQSSLLRKALFGLTLLWSLKISLCFDPGPGWDLCHEICQRPRWKDCLQKSSHNNSPLETSLDWDSFSVPWVH